MVKSTERAAGIYRAIFTKLDLDYVITDKETNEEDRRWRWVFQEEKDPTTVGEMDTITSPSLKARTNGAKFFAGMLGRSPTETDDTDDLLGKPFDVTWGPNQNGRLTIVAVSRVLDGPAVQGVSDTPNADLRAAA